MKRLITMLAVLVSSCAAHATDGPAPMDKYEMLKSRQLLAWEIACEAKHADCTTINRPEVGYSLMSDNEFGYYNYGSPIVVINLKLAGSDGSVAVMVHEMVHYLQGMQYSELEVIFGGRRLWCAREKESFELTWAMKRKYNLVDFYSDDQPNGLLAPKWEDRVVGYGCLDA